MKRCSTSLIIKERQIKTTMRNYLTPVRMATIDESTNKKWWQGCTEKGTLVHCWWDYRLVQPLCKTVWGFLKKIKQELPYDPAIPLLSRCLKQPKTVIEKNIYTPMFIAALFTIAKMWKQPKYPSINEQIKNWKYIYRLEYYSATKNNK